MEQGGVEALRRGVLRPQQHVPHVVGARQWTDQFGIRGGPLQDGPQQDEPSAALARPEQTDGRGVTVSAGERVEPLVRKHVMAELVQLG